MAKIPNLEKAILETTFKHVKKEASSHLTQEERSQIEISMANGKISLDGNDEVVKKLQKILKWDSEG